MKYLILSILGCCLFSFSLQAQDDNENEVQNYILTFKEIAKAEQLRSGVPASITLAQGIHESNSGRSELATVANNHFGIKCKTTWKGETMLHDDDKRQECFRKYPSAMQSYTDHSDFLKGNVRYDFLFKFEPTDYVSWAKGLKKAGYATNPVYATRLINLIEKYNLQEHTLAALQNEISKTETTSAEVVPEKDYVIATYTTTNEEEKKATSYKGLKGFYAKKGDVLLTKAIENNIRYARLLQFNDLEDEPLKADQFIFLERKRKMGSDDVHIVQQGENMQLISQIEAVQLTNLYQLNNLKPNEEPAVGEKIYLKANVSKTPLLASQTKPTIAYKEKIVTPEVVETTPIIETTPEKSTEEILAEIKEKNRLEEEEKEAARLAIQIQEAEKKAEIDAKKEAEYIEQQRLLELQKNEKPVEVIVVQKSVAVAKTVQEVVPADGILDPKKAKKIDQLFGNGDLKTTKVVTKTIIPEETKPDTIKTTPVELKKEEVKKVIVKNEPGKDKKPTTEAKKEKAKTEPKKEVAKVIEEKKPEKVVVIEPAKKPEPKKVDRNYNEPGVSDEVKDLKKRFDDLIYGK
ncbi:MAG: glucosaminidase domain-containing protein [Chitinophagaceae bacterium]|nr:glucosaminidase domain-containing protein [Chitinophagaceae bacterium]